MSIELDIDELAECLQDAEVEIALEKDQIEAEKLEAEKLALEERKKEIAEERKSNESMQSSEDIDCGGLID